LEVNEQKLKKYVDDMELNRKKTLKSLKDGNIDNEDISNITFDIFSTKKKFVYDLRERIMLYFGFLAPIIKCCPWGKSYHEEMNRVNKIFEQAVGLIDN